MFSLPKTLIIDASILFSFFKKDSTRRHLIDKLLDLNVEIISPNFAFEELLSDKLKIMKFSDITDGEFFLLFSLLRESVKSIPESEYFDSLNEVRSLSPHKEKIKDDAYFASAVSLNCPIWSDESAFKLQSKVKVLSTKEILDLTARAE